LELRLSGIPKRPGVYWLQRPGQPLYVGETLDLRQRFDLQLVTSHFGFWDTPRNDLEFRFGELPPEKLLGNQSHWIARLHPLGNYSELAAL
jgi:hypothetical protein